MPALTLQIHEPSGVGRSCWPLTAGIPFAQGALRDPAQVRLLTADRALLPAHGEALAVWPDRSVKWLLLDAQVDLAPSERAAFLLEYGEGGGTAPPALLKCAVRDGHIDVSTGRLSVRVLRSGPRIFESISQGRRELVGKQRQGELSALDQQGRSYAAVTEEAVVEEDNPLRLVVRLRGGYLSEERSRLMSWTVRLYFYAGQEFVRIYHTFVHDQPDRFVHLRRLRFSLPVALSKRAKAIAGLRTRRSWHGTGLLPPPLSLVQWDAEQCTLFAGGRTDFRTHAHGWIHSSDERSGISLKLRHPWQSHPVRLATDGASLDLDLYADLSEFQSPGGDSGSQVPGSERPLRAECEAPLRIPQGMARTHEFFLWFAEPASDARTVDAHCLAFEQPLLPLLPSEYYADTRALDPFFPFREEYWPLELKLRRFCHPPNGRGILDYGDQVEEGQSRITRNLAHDLPRSLLRQYLRTGDQRLFWEAEAAVLHLMDVDTVHFDGERPQWTGGQRGSGQRDHHFDPEDPDRLSPPSPRHVWIGSLLDYYFLTGYRRARETAEACADFCRKNAPYHWKQEISALSLEHAREAADEWRFDSRTVGGALTVMGLWHQAFPHERFLRAMEPLVDLLERWQDEEGRWLDRTGCFNLEAVPFADASVLRGLLLYYQATQDQRTLRLFLKGVRFLVDHTRSREGIFCSGEAPASSRFHPLNGHLLPALAFAFEQTGEAKIIEAGYRLFRWLVESGQEEVHLLDPILSILSPLERAGLLEDYQGLDVRILSGRIEEAEKNHSAFRTGSQTPCG